MVKKKQTLRGTHTQSKRGKSTEIACFIFTPTFLGQQQHYEKRSRKKKAITLSWVEKPGMIRTAYSISFLKPFPSKLKFKNEQILRLEMNQVFL